VTRKLTDVSRGLADLARSARPEGKRALAELATRLGSPRHADLAGIDLAGTYAPAVMLADGKTWKRWSADGLELVRDVLIFVPVIYTWWQISHALHAYQHYKGGAPFLLAWQQGFGHKTQPLSAAAIVVAAVVLGVIVLTFAAHLTRAWYDGGVQRRQQKLAALLAEASLLLTQSVAGGAPDVTKAELATIGTRITMSASSLQEALAKAGTDIVAAVNTNPGSKLHDMFEKWTAAANELKTLGTRLQGTQEMVDQLRATQTALSGMAQQIGNETEQLLAALRDERSLSRQEAHAHHELAASVGESTKLLGNSLKGLNQRAEQFNEMILRLSYVVNRLDPEGSQSSAVGGGYN
jgi:signal transduction histidine kinase